jgi:macrolide-specific efflux system membrane fusion protein
VAHNDRLIGADLQERLAKQFCLCFRPLNYAGRPVAITVAKPVENNHAVMFSRRLEYLSQREVHPHGGIAVRGYGRLSFPFFNIVEAYAVHLDKFFFREGSEKDAVRPRFRGGLFAKGTQMHESSMTRSPKRLFKKPLVIVTLAVTLIGGGAFATSRFIDAQDRPIMNTVKVELGDIERTVTSLGKLKPKDYVDVGTQVSGQLKKVHVNIGDRVNKGDLIAEIDSTVYQTRVRTGRANLDNLGALLVQQHAEAGLARQQFKRNQDLLKERAVSQETVEQNQAALKVAEARVAATRAQIKAAQATVDGDIANLGYTKIHAPMSGTVVSQTSLQGQTVNASQQAPVIVRVADLETMTVWAQVAEADVAKLKPGLPAYFTTLGNGEQRWKGLVRQVMPTPEIVNDVVLYNVLVDVDNGDQALMIDMTVQVFFVLDEARDVPVVPVSALKPVKGKEPNLFTVDVACPDGTAQRTVRTGVTNRTMAAIASGVSVGDVLVVAQSGRNESKPSAGRPGGMRGGPRL